MVAHADGVRSWAAGEVSRILGYDDDVVINLLFDLLEGSKNVRLLYLQTAEHWTNINSPISNRCKSN